MSLKRSAIWCIALTLLLCLVAVLPLVAQDSSLTEEFTPIQSGIRLEHPAGWMAVELQEGTAVVIVNDPTYLGGDGSFSPGQMRIDIFTPQALSQIMPNIADLEPADLLSDFAADAQLAINAVPEAIEIDSRPAARASISTDPIATLVYALEVEPGSFALVFVTLLSEDVDSLLPAAMRLIETIDLFEVVLENVAVETGTLGQSHSTADGQFSFDYPEDWFLDLGDDESSLLTLSAGRPLDAEEFPDITALLLYAPVPYGTNNLDQYPRQVLESNLAFAPGFLDVAPRIPFTLNGRTALRVEGQDGTIKSVAVAVLLDDIAFGYIFATGTVEDMDSLREQILTIAASFEFAGPDFEPIQAQADESLSNNFISENGLTQLSYPPDWTIEERNGLVFVSNMPLAESNEVTEGQVVLLLAAMPYRAFTGIRDDPTPLDLLYQMQPALGLSATVPGYTSFNEAQAARADIETPEREGMLIAVELDGELVLTAAVYANPGDLADYEAILLSILASAQAKSTP